MAKDRLVLSIGAELAASKNRRYRESVYHSYEVLVSFLQEQKLTTRRLLESSERPPNNFQIRSSDLTEEGAELLHRALEEWMDAIASGKSAETDVSILERELKQIRA